MKKNILKITCVIMILTSLNSCYHEKIEGNGKVTIEERSVDSFDHVYIEGVLNVILSQGEEYKVEVETDRNLQDIVNVTTRRNNLYIDMDEHTDIDATKMNVYIESPTYSLIDCDGVGNISTETVISERNLKVINSGVGSIDMEIECELFDLRHDGVGSVYLSGETQEFILHNSGVGKVHAFSLIAGYVEVTNAGVGDCEVFASQELDAIINGIGDVSYKGDPVSITYNISGIGKLQNAN